MAKQNLKNKKEFGLVFSAGKKKVGKYIIVYMMPKKQGKNRLGVIVKKNIGNAVQRNRIKRVLREVWRNKGEQFISGHDVVILAKRRIIEVSFQDIESELENLIK